ncbi:MAG: GHMP kinase [Blastopirellula sp.]|jgi:glucuronokinase|nr:GHMP kinase [Blastopirellula sp.]
MKLIRHEGYARAGLIGNPTDGYGGKTISFTMTNFKATVVMYPWEQLEILWSQEDKNRFDSLDDLVEDVNLNGYYGGVRLVKATIKRFAEYCRAQEIALSDQPFSVRYETAIPRGVGLSGSSAIIVATLHCLMEFYGVSIPQIVQPSLVRAVENEELGIACGYQDRVVQVYQGLVAMDFSSMEPIEGYECGLYESLTADVLPPVYVCYDTEGAKTSASVHGPLRTRMAERADLQETMEQIAALVPEAREALSEGDHPRLHALIDRNFDLRAGLYDIREDHRRMIETARGVGVSAKFAGSGGAIVGTYDTPQRFEALVTAMSRACPAWRVIRPQIPGSR